MKEISLSKGKFALVDDEDFERVSQFKWTLQTGRTTYYAARYDASSGKRKYIYLHRFILDLTDRKLMVDHINGNGLDNRRENLRACTNGQNQRNKSKASHSTQLYKGVRRRRTLQDRYEARIRVDGQGIYLGRYDTPEEAAIAYDNSAIKYFGEFAKLNFERGQDGGEYNNTRGAS